jgi:hypothetical protein
MLTLANWLAALVSTFAYHSHAKDCFYDMSDISILPNEAYSNQTRGNTISLFSSTITQDIVITQHYEEKAALWNVVFAIHIRIHCSVRAFSKEKANR